MKINDLLLFEAGLSMLMTLLLFILVQFPLVKCNTTDFDAIDDDTMAIVTSVIVGIL